MTAAHQAAVVGSTRSRPGPRVPDWWTDLAGSLTWASLLAVVLLWVYGRGLQHLAGIGSALVSSGRLAGLLSADLLLLQVLLTARIPFVERAYGQDELLRRHRVVGFASVVLLVIHIVTLAVGDGLQVGIDPVRQTVAFVRDYPGMWWALVATGFFLLVIVSSLVVARRHLQYETWHLLHLYAYLGVGLSLPHEVASGADFVSSPAARTYWWSLYAVAAGSMLIWRVAVPLWRTARHRLVVDEVVAEGAGIVSVYMKGRHLDRLGAHGGQFFTWRFLDGHGWTRGHPYSLSAAPNADRLRITVKALGPGSRRLAKVRPGARVLIEGPYGRLHPGVSHGARVTLIASGIGITPIRALLEEFAPTGADITLIYRASTSEDQVFHEEIETLAAGCGAHVHHVLGPRLRSRPSWLPESAASLSDSQALQRYAPQVADSDVYICGTPAWAAAVRGAARAAGVPAPRIHFEAFSW